MDTKIIEQAELWRIGHNCLSALLSDSPDGLLRLTPGDDFITIEQAIGAGILDTLLRKAEDLSRLVAEQNMAKLVEDL